MAFVNACIQYVCKCVQIHMCTYTLTEVRFYENVAGLALMAVKLSKLAM